MVSRVGHRFFALLAPLLTAITITRLCVRGRHRRRRADHPGGHRHGRTDAGLGLRFIAAQVHSGIGNGMNTSEPKAGERITAVRVDEDSLAVDLLDGRTVIVPLAWYPRL